jgi:hypothetical protein
MKRKEKIMTRRRRQMPVHIQFALGAFGLLAGIVALVVIVYFNTRGR